MNGMTFQAVARSGIALCAALSACHSDAAAPPTRARTTAEAVAMRTLEAMGGQRAWEETRCVSWNFMGRRRLVWDKATSDVRVESGDSVTCFRANSGEGRAFEKGVEIVDAALRSAALEKARAAFINDAYWMFMPYKLLDPGVHLALVEDRPTKAGRPAQVLELTFDGVGLTPGNRYLVYVGRESGLVEQWDFFVNRDDAEPKLSMPWNRWQRFGQILLCTDHGDGKDWEIAVHDRPPAGAFVKPTPLAPR
jgi:hypothetical protein